MGDILDTVLVFSRDLPVFQDPFCPRSLECCIANTDLPELVLCSVWLPSILAACTALRSSRDFFPLFTLNYSVNNSLEMILEIEVFSLLLRAFQVASVWPKGSLEARLGITRFLLSLRCQTFNFNYVFHKELYKLCSFVFCDMWLKNSSHCFLWMRLALVNPSDFWYL